MKLHPLFLVPVLLVALSLSAPAQALPVFHAKERTWTSQAGTSVRAKLVAVNREVVRLATSVRTISVPIKNLVEKDQARARAAWPADLGTIADFPLEATGDERLTFLEANKIESKVWQRGEDRLPFLFHKAESKRGEKPPLLIHLHGTGGIGKDNMTQLFKDAQGVSKSYFDPKLQGNSPFCVMIPQTGKYGGWATIIPDSPPRTMIWLTAAVQKMADAPDCPFDPKRVCLIGLSMGGQGVCHGMSKYPDFFAGGISISFVENPIIFSKQTVRKNNLWLVVNESDKSNSGDVLRNFQTTYRKLGGELRTSTEDGQGHNAWNNFIRGKEFRTWFFARSLER